MRNPTPVAVSVVDPSDQTHWRRNKIALGTASFLFACGFGVTQSFLPLVLREVGFAPPIEAAMGSLLGALFLISFVLTPVWGVVSDRIGQKAMVLRTSLGIAALTALLSQASQPWLFATIFMLLGTANGFTQSSLALVATTTPAPLLGGALAFVQSGILLGTAVGPLAGSYLASGLPRYRDLYLVFAGLSLVAGLLALAFTRERYVRPSEPFRMRLVQDLRTILRVPNLTLLYLIVFAYSVTLYGSVPITSVFLLQLLHAAGVADAREINHAVGIVALAFTLGSSLAVYAWSKWLDGRPAVRMLTWGLLAGGLGSVPVALAATMPQLAAARLVMGILAAGFGPCALALVRAQAPRHMEGRVLGYASAFNLFGIGAAPFVAGQIGPWLGLRTFFALNALFLLALLAAWRRAERRAASESVPAATVEGRACAGLNPR